MESPLLIPAAGSGKRMGAGRNKLLLPLLGKPILQWTLEAAIATPEITWIGVIGQPADIPDFEQIFALLKQQFGNTKPIHWIRGGETRQESVGNGVRGLPQASTHVLVHDGARCLATPALFQRCAEALEKYTGFVAAVPVKDTIKIVTNGRVQDTPDRDRLWAAQTPQGFAVPQLLSAHDLARRSGWSVTDDAALFEKIDLPVHIVMGEETNLKITTPQDLAIAEFILIARGAVE